MFPHIENSEGYISRFLIIVGLNRLTPLETRLTQVTQQPRIAEQTFRKFGEIRATEAIH